LSNGDWLSVGSYEVTNPPGSEAYGVWVRPCLVFLCYLLRSFLCSLVCCRRDGSR
jgi:hypothetical protein